MPREITYTSPTTNRFYNNSTMPDQSKNLLLKNGTALIHGENDKVDAVRTDILISGSKISMLAANISPPPGSEVTNQTLMQYLPEGNFTSSLHTAEDTFWGQLAGCLEMIDCGTTSVVDFSHVNYSPEHSELSLSLTLQLLPRLTSRCRRPGHLSNNLVRSTLRVLLLPHAACSIMVALHHRAKLSGRPRPSQVRRTRRSGSVGRRSRNTGICIRRLPVLAQRKSPSSDEEAGREQSPADHVPLQPSSGARHNKPDSRAPGPGDSRRPLLGLAWWQSVARGCGHLQAVWHARLEHSEYRASDGHG
jgi:hypothetical protein